MPASTARAVSCGRVTSVSIAITARGCTSNGLKSGRDHQAALGPPRAQEAAQHQAGLDRLAESHLVGEQPAHRVRGGRPLGGVELVREEPDPAAQERAEALRLAALREVQRVEPQRQVLDRVEVERGEPKREIGVRVLRPALVGCDSVKRRGAPREPQRHTALELDHERAAVDRDDASRSELRVVLVPQAVAHAPRVHAGILGARRAAWPSFVDTGKGG